MRVCCETKRSPEGAPVRYRRLAISAVAAGLCGMIVAAPASAWVLTLTPAPRQLFLMVGVGTPGASNPIVNTVSASVPAAILGNGTPLSMTSDSTQAASPVDGFPVCNPPAQVYIGGAYRQPNAAAGPAVAQLQVTTPANLTSGADTIAFTQISWTSTANGNPTADLPAGTFNGATLSLAKIARNTFVENCYAYTYANSVLAPAGTYSGRAVFTLTLP